MPEFGQKKRSNLKDVARAAEVSVATVSRVLNMPARVSPETRGRVERAMKELRFVPSAAARAINSGRTRMVAALLPTLDNSIYARVVDGLEHRLAASNLSLIVAQTCDDPRIELERARALINIGAEGFVLAGVHHDPALFELVDHIQLPAVAVSYFAPDHPLTTIGYDNWEAARLAADHLVALGHRSIAVVHGPLAANDRTRRRRDALSDMEGPMQFRFFESHISVEGGALAAEQLLKSHPQVTAVLCFSDVLAMGVLSALQSRAIKVPDDISVMGMEDLPSSRFIYPALTSVRLQVQRMGEAAAEALAAWLEHGRRPEPMKMKIELIQRASTGPRKG